MPGFSYLSESLQGFHCSYRSAVDPVVSSMSLEHEGNLLSVWFTLSHIAKTGVVKMSDFWPGAWQGCQRRIRPVMVYVMALMG